MLIRAMTAPPQNRCQHPNQKRHCRGERPPPGDLALLRGRNRRCLVGQPLPVLGKILLEAKNDQLRLAATNLEIGVNCWFGARVEDEGAVTVTHARNQILYRVWGQTGREQRRKTGRNGTQETTPKADTKRASAQRHNSGKTRKPASVSKRATKPRHATPTKNPVKDALPKEKRASADSVNQSVQGSLLDEPAATPEPSAGKTSAPSAGKRAGKLDRVCSVTGGRKSKKRWSVATPLDFCNIGAVKSAKDYLRALGCTFSH